MRGMIAEIALKRTNAFAGAGVSGPYIEIFFRIHGTYNGDADQSYPIDTKGKITFRTSNWGPTDRPDHSYLQFKIGDTPERTISLNTISGIGFDNVHISFAFLIHVVPHAGPVIAIVPIAGKIDMVERVAQLGVNTLLYAHVLAIKTAGNSAVPGLGVLIGMAADVVFGKKNTDNGLKFVDENAERVGQIETTDGIPKEEEEFHELDVLSKTSFGYPAALAKVMSLKEYLPESWQELLTIR
ncbi:hypothetical protein HGRIS_005362 [Hohenbuehelia grisea]|uniref:Uncharacterized protein n=1 Tax=Hohenbuehelia grisea TaxID=104357 RepID=A0ABR3JF23_9AGAR